jgi:hypothetical protein
MATGALLELRLWSGLTMRDVEAATARIAFRYADKRYLVVRSQLSLYERQTNTPNLYKFFSLMTVYRCSPARLLRILGIPGGVGGKSPLSTSLASWMRPSSPRAQVVGHGSRRRRKGLAAK